MVDGRDQLDAWRLKRGFSQRDLADTLGCHETYVSQLLTRKRTPGLANAVRIERVTGIVVEAWLPKRRPKVASEKPVELVTADLTER